MKLIVVFVTPICKLVEDAETRSHVVCMCMGPSSPFNTLPTGIRCSLELTMLAVLCTHGVCWTVEMGQGEGSIW